jgi:hypothetical protein
MLIDLFFVVIPGRHVNGQRLESEQYDDEERKRELVGVHQQPVEFLTEYSMHLKVHPPGAKEGQAMPG